MFILGLNIFHANTSAVLFYKNNILCAAEEERFSRVKNDCNFPINSIKYCLNNNSLKLNDIDFIALNYNSNSNIKEKIFFSLKNVLNFSRLKEGIQNRNKKKNLKNILESHQQELGNFFGEIFHIEHHLAHLNSSFYFSNFKESANISIDGFGDFVSTSWGFGKDKNLSIDKRIHFPHSLGIFYQAITQYLGFVNYGDEYKVMGLSAFGEPKFYKELLKLVTIKDKGEFELNLNYFVHHKKEIIENKESGTPFFKNLFSEYLIDLIGSPRDHNSKIEKKHMDIAASLQKVYEDVFFNILSEVFQKYQCSNLCLSGGCAMNSLANGKIIKETNFKNLFIPSNPSDGGGGIGASIEVLKKVNLLKTKDLNSNNIAYTGPYFSNNHILDILNDEKIEERFSVSFLENENLYEYIADQIYKFKVIGWFQDKLEFGPRALGNRSIIANPTDIKIKDIINSKIKRRESFRPFAPAILHEELTNWFNTSNESPFMTEVYPVLEDKKKNIQAVINIDGTGRVQTVKKENNLKFYNLIKAFQKKSGVPILLNTSFNENEPIVLSPKHAIDCFVRTDMDILVLQNYVIER